MIWSMFSLFMFFVIAGEEVVEPVTTSASLEQLKQKSTEEKERPQQEEDCRYHDGPIPRRDLSDYIVDSDLKFEASTEKEIEPKENETSFESEDTQDVEVEPEPTSSITEKLVQ